MDLLYDHGIDVRAIPINTDINEEIYNNLTAVQLYGIYPFSMFSTIETLKKDGKKIVYDFDDAMELVERTSPFYTDVQRDKDSAREILKLVDHVIAATPALKDYISGMTTAPITVIPNSFQESEWTFKRPQRDGIRIGFSGASPHITSLIKVLSAIRNLQKKYDVRFLIMGFGKENYDEWAKNYRSLCLPEGIKAVDDFTIALRGIKYEWIPFVNYTDFPSTLINLSLDIGICTLKDTPFNRCRSASKAMEYNLAGALAIASDMPTFPSECSIKVNDSGLDGEMNWEKCLTYYIENPEERRFMHEKHLGWIKENWNIEKQLKAYKEVYEV
jgi:glycosyltransferase involved in cell wall biosynthesis